MCRLENALRGAGARERSRRKRIPAELLSWYRCGDSNPGPVAGKRSPGAFVGIYEYVFNNGAGSGTGRVRIRFESNPQPFSRAGALQCRTDAWTWSRDA